MNQEKSHCKTISGSHCKHVPKKLPENNCFEIFRKFHKKCLPWVLKFTSLPKMVILKYLWNILMIYFPDEFFRIVSTLYRCSHRRCSQKAVLKNVANFTRKHLFRNLFLKKVARLQPKTPAHVFSCEF